MTRPEQEADDHFIQKPFLEHLEDLRRTLILCFASLAAGILIALPLAPVLLDLLKRPLVAAGYDPDALLGIYRVAGGFSCALRIGFWGGLLIGFPGILAAICLFIFPGLTRRERRRLLAALTGAAALFCCGAALAYTVMMPLVFRVMERANGWMKIQWAFIELGDYVAFVLKLITAFGAAFELPVIVFALGWLGLVNARQLREKRRHVIVGLMVLGMLLTPPDPLTMLMMALPMIALYEACIWSVWLLERRRA